MARHGAASCPSATWSWPAAAQAGGAGRCELGGSADVIAAQVADPAFPVWVLVEDDERVVGCTTLFEDVPTPGWAAAPQREPAFFLATAVTPPRLPAAPARTAEMAAWAVDRAAREGRAWVRLECVRDRLVPYFAAQGFRLVREVPRGTERLRLMARPAKRLPELGKLMAGPLAQDRGSVTGGAARTAVRRERAGRGRGTAPGPPGPAAGAGSGLRASAAKSGGGARPAPLPSRA